jgi:hypothetical protein
MDEANRIVLGRGELPLVGHYLFEYRGVPELTPDGRIPLDAFAHTDPAAIVQLSARLVNGQPLPSWLRLDARGTFRGVPPEDLEGTLEIEVVARDQEGREARTTFSLDVDALRDALAARVTASAALGLDVDAAEVLRARLEAERAAREASGKPRDPAKPAARGAANFSEQMRLAKSKADPLLDRIVGRDGKTPGPR